VVPPSVTLAMAGRIRGASAVLLPAIGHATALQAPETLAQHLVRFLQPAGVNA
jgi:3-oxoadipate enol-lactonase